MADLKTATYAVAGGYDIHIAEAGSGPAVVFLHGSGPGASGASNFRQNIDAFVDSGFRVILPDLIGYGASSKPEGLDYTLQLFTDTAMMPCVSTAWTGRRSWVTRWVAASPFR